MKELKEVSVSDMFAQAIPYPIERLARPITDESLRPHKEILADVFDTLINIPNGDSLIVALGVNSHRLLAYWYGQAGEWILRYPQRQHLPKDEQWVTSGDGRIGVTLEDIDGPVDIRQLTIKRVTPTERDKFTISLDRESGTIEEFVFPTTLNSEVSRKPEDYPTKIYEVTFSKGRIVKLELREYVEDAENRMPSFTRTTVLDFSSVVRWGFRRD